MSEDYTDGVFVVAAPEIVLFFANPAELVADIQRMEADEVRAASFYGLDGEVLELVRASGRYQLRGTTRDGLSVLTAALAHLSRGQDPTDPRRVANEVLRSQWANRWPHRPPWLHRMFHGRQPPSV